MDIHVSVGNFTTVDMTRYMYTGSTEREREAYLQVVSLVVGGGAIPLEWVGLADPRREISEVVSVGDNRRQRQ